jgi:hypothetical protein
VTCELLRDAIQTERNAHRLEAWRERWRVRFGHYPASAERPLSIEQLAGIGRNAGLTVAPAPHRPPLRGVCHEQHHGNQSLRKFFRHKRQRHQAPHAPPEVA